MRKASLLVAVFMLVAPAVGAAPVKVPGESISTELTVYNVNMALVKDTRELTLKRGLNEVQFEDVPSQIDATSVHFESITAPNSCVIREQNYRYDLVDRAKLLQKYLGKELTIREEQEGGGVVVTKGTLLSSGWGLVLQTKSGVVMVNPDRIELPKLPEGLIIKPTLHWLVDTNRSRKHKVEVSYITNGITWDCDYVAVANADDTKLDLNGWVTIDNNSGATYQDAKLKLMAGDVRRIEPPRPRVMAIAAPMMAGGMGGMPQPQFEEKTFFEYHLYSLDRKTTVRDNEMKQVELLTATKVPVTKRYFFDGARGPKRKDGKGKIQVKLEFENSKDNRLGMPLPKGKVRVYKEDDEKSLQFVGEDEIDHTPKDEKVRLYVGDAFDIVGEWTRIGQKKLSNTVWEYGYKIKLRNHKDEDIEVVCVEHAWGDWEIINESLESKKKDATKFEYTVPVPKDGEATVTYNIRITR